MGNEPNPPRVLYLCDFPAANYRGGSIQMSRLFSTYPPDRIIALVGAHYDGHAPAEGRLLAAQYVFPTTNGTGRFGIGRLKQCLDWASVPILALIGIYVTLWKRIDVVVTVAHGRFFVAAVLAARITKRGVILFVHDEWVDDRPRNPVSRWIRAQLFAFVVHASDIVYSISPYMQERLKVLYRADSKLLMPGSDSAPHRNLGEGPCEIIYAGMLTGAVEDSLAFLVDLFRTGALEARLPGVKLDLFIPYDARFEAPNVHIHGWVTSSRLREELSKADIAFLPFSFEEGQRNMTEASYPTKVSDYLGARVPILIFAPPYSTLVRFAKDWKFAEVVDRRDAVSLIDAIIRLYGDSQHRDSLLEAAETVFEKFHSLPAQRADVTRTIEEVAEQHRHGMW
jgi:glycosyltransferase involved in cell wall biosynthesis